MPRPKLVTHSISFHPNVRGVRRVGAEFGREWQKIRVDESAGSFSTIPRVSVLPLHTAETTKLMFASILGDVIRCLLLGGPRACHTSPEPILPPHLHEHNGSTEH